MCSRSCRYPAVVVRPHFFVIGAPDFEARVIVCPTPEGTTFIENEKNELS